MTQRTVVLFRGSSHPSAGSDPSRLPSPCPELVRRVPPESEDDGCNPVLNPGLVTREEPEGPVLPSQSNYE